MGDLSEIVDKNIEEDQTRFYQDDYDVNLE